MAIYRKIEIEKPKKAVGYIRVSTEAQAADDKYGVDAQKQGILEYAKKKNYEIVKWYQDEVCGALDDRPELDKILYGDEVLSPTIEAVIAFKSDRVARDTKLYFYYLFVLEKKNIKLESAVEEFPEGDFANIYRSLMMFVAEQERKNITTRTMTGRKQKASMGGYSGGRTPFGYMVRDGKLVPNPDEAPIVQLIFRLHDSGLSLARIQTILLDSGHRTRTGVLFQRSTLASIVNNRPTYEGMYRYGDMVGWVRGQHEPILKPEVEIREKDEG